MALTFLKGTKTMSAESEERRTGAAPLTFVGEEQIMKLQFPIPMTIRCFKCGNVFEVAFTSEKRHEFACSACGEVEVYDLGALREKMVAANAKMFRKSSGGRFEL